MSAGLPLTFILSLHMLLLAVSGSSSCKGKNNSNKNMKTPDATQKNESRINGVWGATGISIEITEAGATLNYDCAHGTITEKITPDADGRFVVHGFHVRERPGPARQGDDTRGQPATYKGSIDGQSMTLVITLSETNEEVGTYTLTQGKIGRIRKCL